MLSSAGSVVGALGSRLSLGAGGQEPDVLINIPGISTNMYQVSADDIGCNIVVEAEVADGGNGM